MVRQKSQTNWYFKTTVHNTTVHINNNNYNINLPSELWRRWMGGRKGSVCVLNVKKSYRCDETLLTFIWLMKI